MNQPRPGPKPRIPMDAVTSAFRSGDTMLEMSQRFGLSTSRLYAVYRNYKKMKEIYEKYVAKFNELAAMSDKEAAHAEADDTLMHITWEVYHRRLTYDQVVELHKMFERLNKHYA